MGRLVCGLDVNNSDGSHRRDLSRTEEEQSHDQVQEEKEIQVQPSL